MNKSQKICINRLLYLIKMWYLFLILPLVSSELIDLTKMPQENTNVVETTFVADPAPSFIVPPGGCVYSLLTYQTTKPLLPSTTLVACPSEHPCKPLCNTRESGKLLYNNPFEYSCNRNKEMNVTVHRVPGASCAPVCFGEDGVCPMDTSTQIRGRCLLTDVSTGIRTCAIPCDTNDDCRVTGYEPRSCYNHVCLWNN